MCVYDFTIVGSLLSELLEEKFEDIGTGLEIPIPSAKVIPFTLYTCINVCLPKKTCVWFFLVLSGVPTILTGWFQDVNGLKHMRVVNVFEIPDRNGELVYNSEHTIKAISPSSFFSSKYSLSWFEICEELFLFWLTTECRPQGQRIAPLSLTSCAVSIHIGSWKYQDLMPLGYFDNSPIFSVSWMAGWVSLLHC